MLENPGDFFDSILARYQRLDTLRVDISEEGISTDLLRQFSGLTEESTR
jgi:hypothetical protein